MGIGPQNLGASGMNPKSTPCGHPLNMGADSNPLKYVDPLQQQQMGMPQQVGMQQPGQVGIVQPQNALQQPTQTPLYNAGTMYLKKEAAKAAGKDSFTVGDKTFPVKG